MKPELILAQTAALRPFLARRGVARCTLHAQVRKPVVHHLRLRQAECFLFRLRAHAGQGARLLARGHEGGGRVAPEGGPQNVQVPRCVSHVAR